MKIRKLLTSIALCALILPASALEEREFKSADKTKSFKATLTDYDVKKKRVTVQLENGKSKRFPIDILSKEDQAYVKKYSDVLAVSRDIKITFTEVKGKTERSKEGLVRTRKTPTSYNIMVYNRSDKVIENLEVRYSYYYCVGSSSADGPRHTPKVSKGTLVFPKLFGKYNETRETAKITLIRESKKGVAPPVPSGGGGMGGG